jgi:hypothetical protein
VSYADSEDVIEHIANVRRKENVIESVHQHELENAGLSEARQEEEHAFAYDARIVNALETMTQQLELLTRAYQLVNTRDGQIYSILITVSTSALPIKLDLVRPANSENVPTNTIINLPFRPLANLTLINQGTGTLYFTFPKRKNEWPAYTQLPPPASGTNPVPLYLDFKQPTLERITLYAAGASVTLQLITLL